MVTVAAMANTVVMDMARRMLIMLNDMKRLPLMSVKTMKHSASAMTAAQSSKKRAAFLVFRGDFVEIGFGVVCIVTPSCDRP